MGKTYVAVSDVPHFSRRFYARACRGRILNCRQTDELHAAVTAPLELIEQPLLTQPRHSDISCFPIERNGSSVKTVLIGCGFEWCRGRAACSIRMLFRRQCQSMFPKPLISPPMKLILMSFYVFALELGRKKQAFVRRSDTSSDPLFRRAMRRTICFGVASIVLSFSGCQTRAKIQKIADLPGALAPGDFAKLSSGALVPGDIVKLSFPGAPDLSQAQRIRTDGKVSLPLIGEVSAAGKRLGEFQEELMRLYKPELKNSEVLVSLEASSLPVYVIGAVGRPGRVSLDRPMTLLEAIMEAGGISNVGTLKGVRVIRNSNGQHYTQSFDLSSTLNGKNKLDAFYLKPYDMVYVSERFF